jgi:hypothetical protein
VRFSTAPKPKFDHQGYITTPQFPVRSIAYSVTGAYIFVGTEYVYFLSFALCFRQCFTAMNADNFIASVV